MKRIFGTIITLIFLILSFCFVQPVKAASIAFTIISPQSNSVQYDDLKIIISKPSSTYQIIEAKAKVGDREIALTYSDNAYINYSAKGGWCGNLDLNGLSRGEKTLEVTVKDVYGNSLTNSTIFKYTQQPNLNIISPQDYDYSSGLININAEASDLAGEKCTIKVSLVDDEYEKLKMLCEGTGHVNAQVDVSEYIGDKIISFEVSNETGGKTVLRKTVYIETSPLLEVVEKIDGQIIDFKDNKILYKISKNELKIKDLNTANEQLISTDVSNQIEYGYLTPLGAMIVVKNIKPYYICDSLFEYRNGVINYLGRLNSSYSLKVNGNYAIWNGDLVPVETPGIPSGFKLYLKDIAANTITQISSSAGNRENDVTENGAVFYWTGDYSIYKYYNGINSKVSTGSGYTNVYPISDGDITVYRRHKSYDDPEDLILNVNGKD